MTAKQTQILMKRFEEKPQLKKEEKYQLAKLLNVSEKRITVWFWNMRFKRRRQGLLAEGEGCSAVNEISLYYIHYALVDLIFVNETNVENVLQKTSTNVHKFSQRTLTNVYTTCHMVMPPNTDAQFPPCTATDIGYIQGISSIR